ncbi:hypothetical protein ACHAPM_010657 [Fusarium culmorum]
MSGTGLGRLGSTSPDPGASSRDNHALLDMVDGEEGISRGRSHGEVKGPTADLMRRLGVSPERRIKVTPEDDARVLKRIDMVVLPLMLAVYFLQDVLEEEGAAVENELLFGSLATWWLAQLPLGLKPYQTIFVAFGIITVCFSTVLFNYMPDSPAEAKFLDKHDKLIAIERLRMNQTGVMSRQWRWDHFWETMRDVKTWLWFALIFSISVPSGGVGSFGPLLIKSFGFDSFEAILFNAPFGIVQLISTVGGSYVATKYHKKGPVIAFLAVFPIIGCMIMLSTPHTPDGRNTLLGGYYMISVFPGIVPLIYSWASSNTAGDTKSKCNSSVLFIGQSLGNIIGPLLYKPSEAPEYHRGLSWNLLLYMAIEGLVVLTSMYLTFLNRDHSRRRVLAGKDAVIVDYSLYSPEEADRLRRAKATDGQTIESAKDGTVGDRAFDDLTDLMNDEFLYVF